jgi:hypothetical protein
METRIKQKQHLMEKIKRDKNRVNITKMASTDNEGNTVTGGYIFKIDKVLQKSFIIIIKYKFNI